MSVDLKTLIGKVNVEHGSFRSAKDKEIAKDIWQRHSLQTLLESTNRVSKEAVSSLANKNLIEKYISLLTVLIKDGPEDWIKVFVNGFNDSNTQSLCVNSLRTISKFGEIHIEDFVEKEPGLYDATDFIGVAEKACLVQRIFRALLEKVTGCVRNNEELDAWRCQIHVGYFLFSITTMHLAEHLWTNLTSITLSKDCVGFLLETFGCQTVNEFLVLDTKYTTHIDQEDLRCSLSIRKSIICKLLLQWKPCLQRNTWRKNPAIAASFSWCLQQLKFPYLSDFLELLLPPCLLFVDDHVSESKDMGISCLIHIMQHASGEELRWYGRADVIYEALKLQMYTTEESVLKKTHEALLLILNVIVKDNEQLAATTKYDEVFSLILQAAFHENKLVLRRVHTHSLHVFIESLGINVVKYMKRLLELVEEYLEVSDPPAEEARLNALNAAKSLIRIAWPRIPSHSSTIFKVLVKLIHQLTSAESESSGRHLAGEIELLALAVECLYLLKGIDETFVTSSIQQLKELPFCDRFHTILKQIAVKQ